MCDPILVTLLKMQPHYSQSSRENATPSSGTSPVASYKEVSPRGPQLSMNNRVVIISVEGDNDQGMLSDTGEKYHLQLSITYFCLHLLFS